MEYLKPLTYCPGCPGNVTAALFPWLEVKEANTVLSPTVAGTDLEEPSSAEDKNGAVVFDNRCGVGKVIKIRRFSFLDDADEDVAAEVNVTSTGVLDAHLEDQDATDVLGSDVEYHYFSGSVWWSDADVNLSGSYLGRMMPEADEADEAESDAFNSGDTDDEAEIVDDTESDAEKQGEEAMKTKMKTGSG